MGTETRAYVDTSAFIAFLDRSDSRHTFFVHRFADPPSLVTTPLVVGEGHAWFLRRYDAQRALEFLAFVEDLAPLEIRGVDGTMVAAAAELLRKFSDQALTLADAVGLDLMKRLKIRSCWSTDRHLGLTGVPLVVHGA